MLNLVVTVFFFLIVGGISLKIAKFLQVSGFMGFACLFSWFYFGIRASEFNGFSFVLAVLFTIASPFLIVVLFYLILEGINWALSGWDD
ncbi:hypothetical protein ACONJS_001179 [Vibrio parahaemolyticus]